MAFIVLVGGIEAPKPVRGRRRDVQAWALIPPKQNCHHGSAWDEYACKCAQRLVLAASGQRPSLRIEERYSLLHGHAKSHSNGDVASIRPCAYWETAPLRRG